MLIITGVGSPDNRIMSDYAQTTSVKVSDPAGAAPDPTHIPIILPKDIKWTGTEGRSQMATLSAEPRRKERLTASLMKWYPGRSSSRPHYHPRRAISMS